LAEAIHRAGSMDSDTYTGELLDCKAAWAEAYHRTPHGKPVELANCFIAGGRPPDAL